MRAVIQRVTRASVTVAGSVISQIDRGYCVLVGIKNGDTETDVDYIVRKLLSLRLFDDEQTGKPWARNIKDISGEILCVSQFTLFAKTTKGSKPDFHQAMKGDSSIVLYKEFLSRLGNMYKPDKIKDGVFGAMMSVDIVNDGPVTIIIDSPQNASTTEQD